MLLPVVDNHLLKPGCQLEFETILEPISLIHNIYDCYPAALPSDLIRQTSYRFSIQLGHDGR